MTWRSGLGLIDVVALSAIAAIGAHPERSYLKSTKLVDAVDAATGLGPGPAYDLILDYARPWVTPVHVIDFHGNFGSLDYPAAAPRYTEAKLSPAGALAVAAEAAQIAPVPIGLITGNTHRQGGRPPFDPHRIIAALLHLAADPEVDDDELVAMIGPPQFPTGCDVDGDLGNLVAGRACAVTLRARTRQTASGPVEITIDRFPPGVTPREVMDVLGAAAEDPPWSQTHPRLAQEVRFPLQDIMDISDGQTEQIACIGRPDATADDITRLLRTLWPLGTNVLLQLSVPLPALLREWVAAASGEDTATSLHRLDEIV